MRNVINSVRHADQLFSSQHGSPPATIPRVPGSCYRVREGNPYSNPFLVSFRNHAGPRASKYQGSSMQSTPAKTTAVPANYLPVRQAWLDKRKEPILDPTLPIVDPHHHLWDRHGWRYMLEDLLADTNSGHNIVSTVFVQARSMYRETG